MSIESIQNSARGLVVAALLVVAGGCVIEKERVVVMVQGAGGEGGASSAGTGGAGWAGDGGASSASSGGEAGAGGEGGAAPACDEDADCASLPGVDPPTYLGRCIMALGACVVDGPFACDADRPCTGESCDSERCVVSSTDSIRLISTCEPSAPYQSPGTPCELPDGSGMGVCNNAGWCQP